MSGSNLNSKFNFKYMKLVKDELDKFYKLKRIDKSKMIEILCDLILGYFNQLMREWKSICQNKGAMFNPLDMPEYFFKHIQEYPYNHTHLEDMKKYFNCMFSNIREHNLSITDECKVNALKVC